MEEIAELLRETREESGIELTEVSKDLEIDELVLKNIEDGKIGAFKDIFTLKQNIFDYAKYLGLNPDKVLSNFNEYLFEYTSKIPVKEIEKTIQNNKEEDKIVSPYTYTKRKKTTRVYLIMVIILLFLVLIAILWSINQITINKTSAYVVSYRK